jgi:hypothetical protein
MATADYFGIVKVSFMAAAITWATAPDAVAQSQMQGHFFGGLIGGQIGSMRRGQGSSGRHRRRTSEEIEQDCEAQGKEKRLTRGALLKFKAACIDESSPTFLRHSLPTPEAPLSETQQPPELKEQPQPKEQSPEKKPDGEAK